MQLFANSKRPFLFFHESLCDTPKKPRGKISIIVPLKKRPQKIPREDPKIFGQWYQKQKYG